MSLPVNLPEEVEARISDEAIRPGVRPEQVVAEAIKARFTSIPTHQHRRHLAFAAIGTSTTGRTAADTKEILAEGFGRD